MPLIVPPETCKLANAQEAVRKLDISSIQKSLESRTEYFPTQDNKLLVIHQERIWNADAEKALVDVHLSFIDAGAYIESIGQVMHRSEDFVSADKVLAIVGREWNEKVFNPPKPRLTREAFRINKKSRIVYENSLVSEIFYGPEPTKKDPAPKSLQCPSNKSCECK